jgi:hypothetical protein
MILYFMRHVAYMACKEEATEVIDCEFSIQIMQIQNAPGHSREFKWLENFIFQIFWHKWLMNVHWFSMLKRIYFRFPSVMPDFPNQRTHPS